MFFVNYPSALRIGWRVCGSMRTLPIGTLEMSVTAQTSPDAVAADSGVLDVVVAIGVVVAAAAAACCCRYEAMPRLEDVPCAGGWLNSGVCLSLP